MEITSDNYLEKESEIISDIQKCDFLSFDLEMTGIATGSRHFLDSPSERYLKHKISAEKFRIIQLGLVPWFRKTDSSDKSKISYEAKPYNIYVFPGKEVEHMNIFCEVSALIFNSKHGMNFNTWIYKGVNYLNSKQYTNLVMRSKDRNFNSATYFDKNRNIYKTEDIQTYNIFEEKFNEFFNDKTKTNTDNVFKYKKLPNFMVFHLLSKLSGEERNQIYIEIERNEDNNQGEDKLVIKKVTKEEKQKLIAEDNQKKLKEMEKAKGVKNIWDEIIKNKKILIGHNLSIDILFCFSHFGDSLPDDYDAFKKIVNTSFGGLYDTKYLYNNFASKEDTKYDSSLESIYEKLSSQFKGSVNISIPKEFTNYIEKMKNKSDMDYHQADFDAFITGLAFCYIFNNYIDNNKEKDKLLEYYNYKVFFMKTFYKCFDLKNVEEFIEPKTIPYCLRSLTKTCDFDLEKIINDKKLFSLIKEKIYIENTNAMLILIDLNGNFMELEAKLMENNQKYFYVYGLEEFKKILKEEEMQRKDKYKNRNAYS
jgi:poly(A)-specific ribonuclease